MKAAYLRKWREEHLEQWKQYEKEYRRKYAKEISERRKARYRINREKKIFAVYTWKLKNKYGLTREQRENMLNNQGNKCAICKKKL